MGTTFNNYSAPHINHLEHFEAVLKNQKEEDLTGLKEKIAKFQEFKVLPIALKPLTLDEFPKPLERQAVPEDPKKNTFLQKCTDLFFKAIEAIKNWFIRLFGKQEPIETLSSAGEVPTEEAIITLSSVGEVPTEEAIETFSSIEEVPAAAIFSLQDKLINPNPKHALISLKSLQRDGFLPKYKMKYANATYYFSDQYTHGSNLARIMFVEINGKVHPRVIYQSNSQAVWRVMPMIGKGFYKHIGKGKIESDTQLPLEVNLALHALPKNKPKGFSADNLVKTEIGPHDSWNEKVAIKTLIALRSQAPQEFYKEGMNIPRPPNPKDIKLPDAGSQPDFSTVLKEAKIEVAHYGKLTARIFPSKDGKLHYLFYEAEDGRAFIAAIEKVTQNPINKFGVRSECPESNNMDAPLLEYFVQIAPGYEPGGHAPRYCSSKYESNWNYVRELPLIQLYYSERGIPLPDKV